MFFEFGKNVFDIGRWDGLFVLLASLAKSVSEEVHFVLRHRADGTTLMWLSVGPRTLKAVSIRGTDLVYMVSLIGGVRKDMNFAQKLVCAALTRYF